MGIQHRRYKRVILKKEVLINGSIRAQGLDLSVGGMYANTGRTFALGDQVTVTLPLNGDFINIRGRVQNMQPSMGIGIMFADLSPEQRAALTAIVASAAQTFTDAAKKTVLLVEDNEMSRRMNRSKLLLDGYSILEAQDGIEALDVLERKPIDLVVLDLYMERLDGYKVLSIVRQKPEWKDLPVLVLSARSSSDEVDKAISAGATEFLVKMTTSPLKLSQRINAYLGIRR
jgi:CheY-like chemotaxis protein